MSRNGYASLINKKSNKTFKIYKNVNADLFHDIFEIVQKYLYSGDAVDVHSVKDYKKTKNYLTDDGLSGFSITPNGDLISVFNLGQKGFLKSIEAFIKKEGATTLDCFKSSKQDLSLIYSKTLGFKTASIIDFNYEILIEDKGKEYANYFVNTYGKAPVAFMLKTDADVETKHFNKNQYDEALEYRNSLLENNTSYSISAEQDNEYMKAVENEAQKAYEDYNIDEVEKSLYNNSRGDSYDGYEQESTNAIQRRADRNGSVERHTQMGKSKYRKVKADGYETEAINSS